MGEAQKEERKDLVEMFWNCKPTQELASLHPISPCYHFPFMKINQQAREAMKKRKTDNRPRVLVL